MIAYPDDHPRGCDCATCSNARRDHRQRDVELRRRQASRGRCHCGSAHAAAARVQRFLDEHHDPGRRVAVEPFTVDLAGKPREVVALELRIDGRDHVVVFHVFEPVEVLTLTTTVGAGG